jgi:hypothetical protein
MTATLQVLHILAGLLVAAEALNKLERTTPCAPGLTRNQRQVAVLKAIAWVLLALAGAGAVAAPVLLAIGVQSHDLPLLRLERPLLGEVLMMLGFAVLIVRTRVKEG